MTTWEYKVVYPSQVSESGEELLNSLGREGWELVTVTYAYASDMAYPDVYMYFKSSKRRVG